MNESKRLTKIGRILSILLAVVGVYVIGRGVPLHGEALDWCPLIVGSIWTGGALGLARIFTTLNKSV